MIGLVAGIRRPFSVFGPSLTKELRGCSRRMRHYALRLAYIAALGLFVTSVWVQTVDLGSRVYHVSRMAEAGKSIIVGIIWFEFIAAQATALLNRLSGARTPSQRIR